jgi:site-specific recombinase XerD
VHLERVRDLFVLQASTGLRYSDLANLKPENRQGNVLLITTIKTRDPLLIPLSPTAKSIYAKYEESGLPKVIENQPYNREIKEACRLAGITDLVPVTVIRNGLRVDTSIEKCDKVTSHTARRTFIIHMLERGVRPEVLMKVTGHKDIKTLMRYVKITPAVVVQELERAWATTA